MPGCGLGKGRVSQEISGFFSLISVPQAPEYSIGAVSNFFSKILGDIRESIFITGVNDTGDKLFTGVNDSGMIISANFRKIQTVLMGYSGAGGHRLMKKTPS
jgi:hypothetical protein